MHFTHWMDSPVLNHGLLSLTLFPILMCPCLFCTHRAEARLEQQVTPDSLIVREAKLQKTFKAVISI